MQDYLQRAYQNGKSKNNLGYGLDCLPLSRFLGIWLSLLLLLAEFPPPPFLHYY